MIIRLNFLSILPGYLFSMDSDENFCKTAKESEQLLATALKDHKPYKDLAKKRSMRRQLITKTISKIQSTVIETEFEIKCSKLICLTHVTFFNAEALSTKCARQACLWSAGSLDTLPWLRVSRLWSLGQCQCFFFLNCYTCLRLEDNLYLTP